MLTENQLPETAEAPTITASASRRNFLAKLTGVATIGVFAACQKNIEPASESLSATAADDLEYGTGDIAVLNYAYLLEQLEANFYTIVASNFYAGATDWEKHRFTQIRDHEIAHREFLKTALGDAAIPEMEFDFSSINFNSKASVVGNAKTFEDLGVSAYNGAGNLIVSPDYLLAAGKIVSVEARHAAYIRDLLDPVSFADHTVVDDNGLDVAATPAMVIAQVKPFLITPLNKKWFPK